MILRREKRRDKKMRWQQQKASQKIYTTAVCILPRPKCLIPIDFFEH